MTDAIDAIARAVLYEGYLLYPYTRSAVKNQVRWTFGGVHPPDWPADPSVMRTECLLRPGDGCRLRLRVRCLQLTRRTAPGEDGWQEAVERTMAGLEIDPLRLRRPRVLHVELPAGAAREEGVDRAWELITGRVELAATPAGRGVLKVTVGVENTTALPPGAGRDEALLRTMVSTHTIIHAERGELISLADPPPELQQAARSCANLGTWPVLVGAPGSHAAVLSSPIILEDYPRVAEESPGDLFDATEIDEILSLRVLTLSEGEKAELRRTDGRARELLDRTEALTAEQWLGLHGTLREPGRTEGGGG